MALGWIAMLVVDRISLGGDSGEVALKLAPVLGFGDVLTMQHTRSITHRQPASIAIDR